MSGGCVIEQCERAALDGKPICAWHASQVPPGLYAKLMIAWTAKARATWRLGLFRSATECSREAAEQAYADAAAEVRAWWAGEAAR